MRLNIGDVILECAFICFLVLLYIVTGIASMFARALTTKGNEG